MVATIVRSVRQNTFHTSLSAPTLLEVLCFSIFYPYLIMESIVFQDLSSHKYDLSTHMYHHLPFTYILTQWVWSVSRGIHQK